MGINKTSLPLSWESIKLGTFVENMKGKKPKRQSANKTEDFSLPYIDIEAFEDGNIKSWTDGDGCRLCNESDFLMVWDGSRSGLVGKGIEGALGSTLVRINFPGMHNQYAYYFLLSKYQEINTRAKGSGTPHVDPDLLWNYDFPIPPLNEQKRIVAKIEELFSELNNGIAALKTAREQLKVYRQAILKHAFEGKLTAKWRKENADKLETPEQLLTRIQQERNTRYQQQLEEWKTAIKDWEALGKEGKKPGKPTKPTEIWKIQNDILPVLPNGWCWFYFGDLVTIASNLVSPTDFLDLPHIAPDNIERDTGKLLSYRTIGEDGVTSPKHYFFSGQIIYSKIRPNLSKLVLVDFDGLCSADMYPLESDYYKHSFLKYLMLTKNFVIQSATAGSRSVLPKINQDELNKLTIPCCPISEQIRVIEYLEENLSFVDNISQDIEVQLSRAETLRQSILKKAFSGQLVQQDPKDEPAGKLLERIKTKKEQQKPPVKKSAPKKRQKKVREDT